MKVSNKTSRHHVESCQPFSASNLFAENDGKKYVVYSYGKHFPIYAKIAGIWYANTDRYSVSTSRHQSQSRPLNVSFVYVDTNKMKELINN